MYRVLFCTPVNLCIFRKSMISWEAPWLRLSWIFTLISGAEFSQIDRCPPWSRDSYMWNAIIHPCLTSSYAPFYIQGRDMDSSLIGAPWCIYASGNLAIIVSDNILSPDMPQAIIRGNAGLFVPMRTYFYEILLKIKKFSCKKMTRKTPSAKWWHNLLIWE